jgi:hypothetical protein
MEIKNRKYLATVCRHREIGAGHCEFAMKMTLYIGCRADRDDGMPKPKPCMKI